MRVMAMVMRVEGNKDGEGGIEMATLTRMAGKQR
jgi:hypothetical protein